MGVKKVYREVQKKLLDGTLADLRDILTLVPTQTLANDLNTSKTSTWKMLNFPATLKVRYVMKMARLFGVDDKVLFIVAFGTMEMPTKTKPTKPIVPKAAIVQYAIDKVREKRREQGLSQCALSMEMGVSHSFVGQVETPIRRCHYNLAHLNKIAKALNCSPQDFLPDEPLDD